MLTWMFLSPGSEGEAGVSGEAGVARRDELGLRRRSARTVGHVRRRIHVSLNKTSRTGSLRAGTLGHLSGELHAWLIEFTDYPAAPVS